MKINTGNSDRVLRLLIAGALAALVIGGIVSYPISILVWIVVIIFAATALIGRCPMYKLFGINTKEKGKFSK